MVKVTGSIDNGAIWNTTYYLIFTDNEIYQFLTMKGKESRSDMWHAQMGNPDRMMPVGGAISNYKVTQEESARLVQENIQRAKK